MVATHMKIVKHSKLCMTGVYLRDITNTCSPVFHLNVSHLSICFSGQIWFGFPPPDRRIISRRLVPWQLVNYSIDNRQAKEPLAQINILTPT